MGANSKIEWTDYTFNPWWGCQRVSPACEHCYAETFAKRIGYGTTKPAIWGPPITTARRFFTDAHWAEPLKWNAQAERDGVRHRVFCASMADVFEAGPMDGASEVDWARDRLWKLVEETPHLIWMLLTKRPEHIERIAPSEWWTNAWPRNVWVGCTVENQEYAGQRIPHLLKVPAPVRFLSCEPLLGPVSLDDLEVRDLGGWCRINALSMHDDDAEDDYEFHGATIDWVIAGGESGPNARPMHPDWARSLRDQCQAAGVSFFFKQWGEWGPSNAAAPHSTIIRLGKRHSGRELDGRTWDEMPALVGAPSCRS